MTSRKHLQRLSAELSELVMHVRRSSVTISGSSVDMGGSGSGSGWVFDSQGHVVTNHHVVDGMHQPITVKPSGRPPLSAVLIGSDPDSDLAVIKVDGIRAAPLEVRLGPPLLGELCVAVGSPLNYRESASLGIVSGLSRQLPTQSGAVIEEVIQTDASINPGNSGGPLVDVGGFVLGVNTAGRTDAQNIGFAVPGEVVLDVVPEIIRFGGVHRSSLGISIAGVWQNVNGIDKTVISVRRVSRPDSKLCPGDILLQIDETLIERRYDVKRALNRGTVGRVVPVWVERDGAVIEVAVRAEAR